MWFWFWFDGLVGGVEICASDNVLVGGMVVVRWLCFFFYLLWLVLEVEG